MTLAEFFLSYEAIISLVFQFVALLASIAVAVAAIRTTFFPPSTWKEQLKAKNEYDLARRLIKSIYKYRDTINSLEYNFICLSDRNPQIEAKIRAEKNSKKAFKIQRGIKADILEAEALWDNEIKDITREMFILEFTLNNKASNRARHFSPNPTNAEFKIIERQLQNHLEIETLTQIDALVARAETYLKEKLKL